MTLSTIPATRVRAASPQPVGAAAPALEQRLSALYDESQRSDFVFGSPLGPFFAAGRHFHLPRFVYFGPQTHDESLRLAFVAGFDAADLRTSLGLTQLVNGLAVQPDLGHGLNLSFFPLVDVLGLAGVSAPRPLATMAWSGAAAPELQVLEQDARLRGYHGFVRLEAPSDDELISVRLRHVAEGGPAASGVELLSSDDFDPWPVRWEAGAGERPPADGPLSASADLALNPFELSLRFPAEWTPEMTSEAITTILKRFILRHRAHQAYGQHL